MAGIFDLDAGVDFDEVQEVKFENVPAGIYGATVAKIEDGIAQKGKSAGKHQLIIDYTITDADDEKWIGKPVREFKTYTLPNEPGYDPRGLGYIKSRFMDLGMPKGFKGQPDPENFLGVDVILTLVEKDGYVNVRKVEVAGASEIAEEVAYAAGKPNPTVSQPVTQESDNPFA